MRVYKCLNQEIFTSREYRLVPIRHEDRYDIMQWRNEQIYHLRQSELLTVEKQENYFNTTVASLFNEERPNQILFSFLEGSKCIGYGGLVHINWIDKNAELSFIMETQLEKEAFNFYWSEFLTCIEKVAFEELNFHKIYTYAFDLRPHLYTVLEGNGLKREAALKDQCLIEGEYKDVVIHSLINKHIELRKVDSYDVNLTYSWAINAVVRQYSLNKSEITLESHKNWFNLKLNDDNCLYFIAEKGKDQVGSFRLDLESDGSGYISYLIDPTFHGNGYGSELLRRGIRIAKENPSIKNIIGEVMIENKASVKAFDNLGFTIIGKTKSLIRYKLITE
ncbi:GNAT family N-acetyltransferase [Schleiferiaceae bacterium]|nr:GNAT family N-acetyltransferase [Schleiferiaceae bacterium]